MKISGVFHAFLILAVVGCSTASAQAVRIVRASYGVTGAAFDVTGQVQSLVNRGQFSFPVNNRFFGGDPAPRRGKGFYVSYLVNGRQFSQEASENTTFTFRNLGFRPGPVAPPSGPSGEIRFLSQTRAPVRLYLINPFGAWKFVANLSPGARFSVPSNAGERYIVTDSFNRILREVRAPRRGETVVIR